MFRLCGGHSPCLPGHFWTVKLLLCMIMWLWAGFLDWTLKRWFDVSLDWCSDLCCTDWRSWVCVACVQTSIQWNLCLMTLHLTIYVHCKWENVSERLLSQNQDSNLNTAGLSQIVLILGHHIPVLHHAHLAFYPERMFAWLVTSPNYTLRLILWMLGYIQNGWHLQRRR